ncbi:CotS family spore coat protein [Paenibacillus allorhizosphaerae]|uniref:Spore coat protein I n=1 Tax=Paenibacillus allorhizosphaerae TaxID=2849866 RepID=A0ABN7TME8_9BACL|nr:CotS family spore coat protein [Paenibacillus allorhizosphaerae]CAG7635844.1 Spore coat protein I [Paenibacillus allorhizosphaerae]
MKHHADTEERELGMRLLAEHYPQLAVDKAEVIQTGGIKSVWKVHMSQGTWCLKRIRKSTAVQVYLHGKGALVADIVRTKDDRLYFVHDGYALVLYMWIEGSDLFMDEAPDLYTGLKGLAQFHNASVGFMPPADGQMYDRMGEWLRHYRKMRDELTQWRNESKRETSAFHRSYWNTAGGMISMADQAIQWLEQSCYSQWVQSIGQYGPLCHQDYGKGNALLTKQGVYILDLDNLAYDIPVRDARKLITKRMERLGRWDQRRVLYIDLLFPHPITEMSNGFSRKKSPTKGVG